MQAPARRPSRRRHTLAGIAFGLALTLTGVSASAHAQLVALGEDVVKAVTISEPMEQQIKGFIEKDLANLSSKDADAIASARKAALAPLASASVAFRLRYAVLLQPKLKAMLEAAPGGEMSRINALVIAGELATKESVGLIQGAHKSESNAVRYQAAASTRSMLRVLASTQNDIVNPSLVTTLVEECAKACAAEKDHLILDANLAAICEGLGKPAFRPAAASQLSAASRAVLAAQKNQPLPRVLGEAFLRGGADLREMLTQDPNPGPGVTKSAGEYVGDVLAHVRNVVRVMPANAPDKEVVARYGSMAQALGQVVTLADPSRKPADSIPSDIAGKSAVELAEACNRVIESLSKPPFGVDPARYK
jgi:hypothetical protein